MAFRELIQDYWRAFGKGMAGEFQCDPLLIPWATDDATLA
jgi:hypothetical protein